MHAHCMQHPNMRLKRTHNRKSPFLYVTRKHRLVSDTSETNAFWKRFFKHQRQYSKGTWLFGGGWGENKPAWLQEHTYTYISIFSMPFTIYECSLYATTSTPAVHVCVNEHARTHMSVCMPPFGIKSAVKRRPGKARKTLPRRESVFPSARSISACFETN